MSDIDHSPGSTDDRGLKTASLLPSSASSSPSPASQKPLLDLRTKSGQIALIILTLAVSALIPYLPHFKYDQWITATVTNTPPPASAPSPLAIGPQFWVYQKGKSESHLKHVFAVLERLGIARSANSSSSDDWDLLWAHDYPFRSLYPRLHRLRPHQLVNHFPGTGFLTNKVDLATTAPHLKYVPRAFKLPAERDAFLAYTAAHPEKQFVQKHNQHRHIFVRNVSEVRFDEADTFVQEFVANPYLVDGHKFDMGVYVTITSVDPLRVYIYGGDVLFRYCPLQYHPFDAQQLDKYVVGDDYMPTWEVPSLAHAYTRLGYGMRGAFDSYVRSRGQRPERIWTQVEDAIRVAVLAKEKHIVQALKAYPHRRNFFEMMRFDLGLDADLNVFLMEANMSPNLSSAHFQPNQQLYEQVIYNLMRLVGVASPLNRTSFAAAPLGVQQMLSASKNIMLDADVCTTVPCTESCAARQCQLCLPCLSADDVSDLHASFEEHMRRGDQKRIFPNTDADADEILDAGMSRKNTLLSLWYRRKCEADVTWCS